MLIRPKTLEIWAGGLIIVLGASLFLWIVPATPGQAVRTAERFVNPLKSHELAEAYQLTTQGQEVGSSLADFQSVVARQWPTGSAATVQCVAARPSQSYGNRLRRWVQRREIECQN